MANLSGTWLGTYWQENLPTRFELTLVQGGNTISGNILDDSALGEASLVGEVIGRKISFNKTYIGSFRHSVQYVGTISANEQFMSGKWRIFRLRGNWEAHRIDDNLTLNLESLRQLKIPVSGVPK